jgi:hypothetical protein
MNIYDLLLHYARSIRDRIKHRNDETSRAGTSAQLAGGLRR